MGSDKLECGGCESKRKIVDNLVHEASRQRNGRKINLVWLETTGCSGNIISLLNAENPGVGEMLRRKVNLCYNNSLMAAEGERALEKLFSTAQGEFVLAVEGALATGAAGKYNIIGRYRGKPIPPLEAVRYLGFRASYVLAVGTCASYGGMSAARPNPTGCISVVEALRNREVIRVPGCPCHPDWFIGTLAHLILYGKPALDNQNRPILFYGITIHDNCNRRSFFDKGIFATKLGQQTCMFRLGCRGPVTKTDCPTREWNGHVNWPVGANTPCIGCANPKFPDGMEPFVRYWKGGSHEKGNN